MESASPTRDSSSTLVRGWRGLGSIRSTGSRRSSSHSSLGATDRIAARPRPMPFGRSATGGYLLCKLEIGVCARTVGIMVNDGLAEARRLSNANVPGDDRIEHQFGEVLLDFPLDVLCQ